MEGGAEEDFVEADCHDTDAQTVYTNLRANRIKVRGGKTTLSVIPVLHIDVFLESYKWLSAQLRSNCTQMYEVIFSVTS